MKQLLLCIAVFLLLENNASAQLPGDVPVAKPVSQGIWVFLGKSIPKNMTYQIERRKEGSRSYEKIGTTTVPASQQEMQKRQEEYHKYFEALDPINSKDIIRLWEYIQKHSTTDSMYSANLPMMHLVTGTAFFDKTAEANGNYIYRVMLTGSGGNSISQKESNPSSSLKKVDFPKLTFISKEYADGKLSVTWSVKDPLNMSHFNIYRSVFGKDEYQRLGSGQIQRGVYSENDLLRLLAIDPIGNQPGWYEYLIAPVDAFGNEGERQAKADGGNIQDYYAPPVSNFRAVSTNQNHEVRLSWRFENKRYLNGITVMRSSNYDSGYQRIATLPVGDTAYTDMIPETGENFYYYLVLNSANNNPVSSAKVFVAYTGTSEKPIPPSPVDAITIPNGIKVYWKDDNSYAKGFFVYRRFNTMEDFIQASPMIPKGDSVYSFIDTSGLLQRGEVYEYIVRTLSEDGQLSKNSDTVTAYPGIKAILTAPMNLRYHINDGVITLMWDDMTDWEKNLLGYKVYRKVNNGAWESLPNDSIQSKKNFYMDSTMSTQGSYSYAVAAWDHFGNESEKAAISLPGIKEMTMPPPPGISLRQTGNGIYITWGQTSEDYSAIKIYRSEPGQQPRLIGTVKEDDFYEDKNVAAGRLYFYQFSTVNNQNKEGGLSDKLSIRVR
ncbi:MAG: hypothetical protein KIT80_00290 [Chitinophagaceae bacterium]|nr:hypothetical protein [Chitinophagaceae bacterium]MCW5925329.1 hypothetical protein [Chitinophagaceae bacterium]